MGFVDALMRSGAFPLELPLLPGIEVCGRVRKTGRGDSTVSDDGRAKTACRRGARLYECYLGFHVAMDEDRTLMLAATSTPTTPLIVAWPSATTVDPELLSVDVSIEVADVDAAHELAPAAGLEIVHEVRDEP